ncbi:hypothetical protein B0H13DRAFT_1867652 [Mycena leptocephala]|nr:hypothetical protein B0H13DRAFT_1867652 [Mycena leptocephala]
MSRGCLHPTFGKQNVRLGVYGTVLHFTLTPILHILGLVLEVAEDPQTRFDSVQLAPERRQDLTDMNRYDEAPRCQGLAETLQGGHSRKNRGLFKLASSSPRIALTSQFRAASQPSSTLFYSARYFPPLARLEREADDEESEDASPAYQAREKLYQVCIIVPC